MGEGDALGLLRADVAARTGGNGEVLHIVVPAADVAGQGVDVVVVLLAAVVELHLIDPAAVVPVHVHADERDAAFGQPRVRQGDRLGLGPADVGLPVGAGGGQVGVARIAAAGHLAHQVHRLGGAVPVDGQAHGLADGPDGQIGAAVVADGVDRIALAVLERLFAAVELHGDVGAELGGNGLPDRAGGRGPRGEETGYGENGNGTFPVEFHLDSFLSLFHARPEGRWFLSFHPDNGAGGLFIAEVEKNFFFFSEAPITQKNPRRPEGRRGYAGSGAQPR